MGYGQMADTYFRRHPDVLQVIQELETRRRLHLFKRLRQQQHDINFLSWLAEMRFGVQFDKMASTITYDRKIDGQTPDWIIKTNNQKIIAEVARLNLSEPEMKAKISEFVSPPVHDSRMVATATTVSANSQYFFGKIDRIEAKEIAYRDLVKRLAFPFIICIDCSTLDLVIFDNDVHDFFIADGKRGYFFENRDFGENVTGLFLRDPFNQYTYFNNPVALHQLDRATLSFFSRSLPGIF
jgi:hypothetical protein